MVAPALQSQSTADTAAMRIETVNGSFGVEQRLRTVVECGVNSSNTTMNGGVYAGRAWMC